MKTSFKTYILAATLFSAAGTAMAQDLNSAYFLDGFKYRHTMNPALGNDQGYVAVPFLGNMSMKIQGSLGVGDLFYSNPDFGKVAGAKRTATFLHPGIDAATALGNLEDGANNLMLDIDMPIISAGFAAFGGYNTVELRSRTNVGLSLPYDFFEFAKTMRNDDYSFDAMGFRAQSFVELGFGHSHKVMDNLRVGAKVKLLFGLGRADISMENMHANLQGDQWVIEGNTKAEINVSGAKFKEKDVEYKNEQRQAAQDLLPANQRTKRVDGLDIDGAGLGGFGLGFDLGAEYEFKDFDLFPYSNYLNGLKVSLAFTDLGFINWNTSLIAQNSGKPFYFSGFNNLAVSNDAVEKAKNEGKTDVLKAGDKADNMMDDLSDFANLENRGDDGGSSTALAATMRLGLSYPLPVYDKLTFGFLYSHRFAGEKYSWSEGRLSANVAPVSWLDGGINVAFTSFCTTMGWVINFHPSGFNFFVGMDHLIGKTGASSIPLDSNVSFNVGMNVTWPNKKKEKTWY